MKKCDWVKKAQALELSVNNYINGVFAPIGGEEAIDKHSPRDGTRLYKLPCGDMSDVDDAVASASAAFNQGEWSRCSVHQRKAVLYKLADLLEANKDEFALLECLDVGKPINNALMADVPGAVATLRYAAETLDKVFDASHCDGPVPNLSYLLRKPVGVVAAIVGWNFPLMLAVSKLAPALAMGNSVVLKPSEFTSLSASRLAALAVDAGLPVGVFNVVHGSGAVVGSALAHHSDVRLISFTGSTATGKQLMLAAGNSNMKRLILECGGKSPYIVFDDCPDDLDLVARDIVDSAFPNQGELCAAGSRLLIQKSMKSKLLPKILEYAKTLRPDDPLDPEVAFGALINQSHLDKVLGYIALGKQEGAKLILGGERHDHKLNGYYLGPAIFDDVCPDSRLAQEEIFGPVLSIHTFDDEDEAITMANNSRYGLAAFAATQNMRRIQRLARQLDAGVINVLATSAVSGGCVSLGIEGHKETGFGMEGGVGGLMAYTVTSNLNVFL